MIAAQSQRNLNFPGGAVIFAIMLPVVYGVAGFIGGVLAAVIYNLIAKVTGGIEFTLTDVPSS